MRIASICLTLLATACGPKLFVVPGGELQGTLIAGPVENWSFTDDVKRLQLETRPEAPYSIHLFGVSSGEAIYVASQGWRAVMGGGTQNARWVSYVAADPRVRLRVGTRLYERQAIPVKRESELARVKQLFQKKYREDAENWGFWQHQDHEGNAPLVYRLEPRDPNKRRSQEPLPLESPLNQTSLRQSPMQDEQGAGTK